MRSRSIRASIGRTAARPMNAGQRRSPDDFAFAVKLPKQITHELRLAAAEPALDIFLDQVSGLGAKLGPILRPAAAKSGIRFRCGARVLCRATGAPWGRRGLRAAACDLVHRRSRRTAGGPPNCTRRRGSTGRHCAFRAGRLARAALLSPARCAAHLLLRLRRRVRGAPCPDISRSDRGHAGASSTIRPAERRPRMRCCCNGSWRGFKPREARRTATGGQGSRVSPLARMQTGLSPHARRGDMPKRCPSESPA